ncbi:uncharacterized protein LOC132559907 [Ylistrum balloti]|uniref:uncharacterized protein LOC132559907 n=1 Tax=Ylistrum balloti TaxID=509963 RepID=UPI0029058EF6|nr:uncharacterized protein LOC132559907 [Ylistrum balloti]
MDSTILSVIRSLTIDILLSTVVRAGMKINYVWKEDITEENVIFNDSLVFTKQISGLMSCAGACGTHSVNCVDFSYTTTTEECRGYDGLAHDRISQENTKMYRNVCRLPGYTYDPSFDACLRLYTTARTWFESSEECSNDTAHLLIIDTMDKLQATQTGVHKDLFAASNEWWIDGYDFADGPANDFRWSNGESMDIPQDLWFHPSQPSDEDERCINLFLYPNFLGLNDYLCSDITMFYVCQEDI